MTEDEIILTNILKCNSIDLIVHKPVLNASQQEQFQEYKRRRLNGEPLQYILGTANFMGLELMVNPSVLVPRPETEQLVDQTLQCFKGGLVLDIGTGSGNIAIALAKFVDDCSIISIDISVDAQRIARINAKQHHVENKIQFINIDLAKLNLNTQFDLIISNPPYIPTAKLNTLPQDVRQEPRVALDGGTDGLDFYRQIIKSTPSLLREGACLMMEFGDGQAESLKKLLKAQALFSEIEIFQDLARRDRIIKAIR